MEENIYTATEYENSMRITAEGKTYLTGIVKWAKFLSVVGFIMIGILAVSLLISGIVILSLGVYNMPYPFGMGGFGWPYFIISIIMLIVCFFPIYYLYSFSAKCKVAIANNDSSTLSVSLDKLKKYFTIVGIFAIIGLIFYIFMIINTVVMMAAII